MKRDLKASAQAFQAEGKVSSDPVGELHKNKEVGFDVSVSVHFINLDFFFLCDGDINMGLQLLMPRADFYSSGGRFSGTYLLPGLMRSTQKLLHLISRLV